LILYALIKRCVSQSNGFSSFDLFDLCLSGKKEIDLSFLPLL